MNYLLFANPVSGSKILSNLKKYKPPSVVITSLMKSDSWKRILKRIITGRLTVEDKVRYFYKIPFYDYNVINSQVLKKIINRYKIEIGIITTFSKIIPNEYIELFPKGVYNFHPSLLPVHGGADPFFWVIYNGDEFTGTTCHLITDKLDSGEIILQKKYKVGKMNSKKLYKCYTKDIRDMLPKLLQENENLLNNKREMGRTVYDPKIKPKEAVEDNCSKRSTNVLKRAISLYKH